jgi:ribonuclease-3
MRWQDAHAFSDPNLLLEALTHASWAHEHGGPDNERLEFLGDAVLQLCVSRALVAAFPGAGEGELSRMRQQLVNTRALAAAARAMALGADLRLGHGEAQTGGRDKDTVLAGALEALLGAVFRDAGYGPAEGFVRAWTAGTLAGLTDAPDGGKDARSRLQERTQRDGGGTPRYEVVEQDGPAHAPVFAVEVRLGPAVLGRGRGPTKKDAARRAAEEALAGLDRGEPPPPGDDASGLGDG